MLQGEQNVAICNYNFFNTIVGAVGNVETFGDTALCLVLLVQWRASYDRYNSDRESFVNKIKYNRKMWTQ